MVGPTAKSYLVWTPLAEHRGRIDRIRLSYKISNTEHWQRIEDRPEAFPCPEGPEYVQHIKPGDYCYDLSGLQYDIQYTGDVSYYLHITDLLIYVYFLLFFCLLFLGNLQIEGWGMVPQRKSIVFYPDCCR